MGDHLMLAESGYRLVPRPPPAAAPAHGAHVLRTLPPYAGPGLDGGLRPRGVPLGPPPPVPGALAYAALGPPPAFHPPFAAGLPPAAAGAHLQPAAAPPGAPGVAAGPAPGSPAQLPPPPPPLPAHALAGVDAELIDEDALTSLELELGLHRVRELPELFLGQSEFDCFSDLGLAPPPAAGPVSC
ncbi:cbp/p300-interacting transactivator 4 [Sorex fumeus]|uniref:cbp/p300-interacting transactivator 4 n=1 Tax=Sorex fumeus TaxID=62283 RepID=UPI0024AD6021|nr:cbp/p300-interacting transactivator 4 [Sorex fumeus]